MDGGTAAPVVDTRERRRAAADWLHSVLPLLIAAPAMVGVILTLVDLVTTRHPYLGGAIANDGKALAVGIPIYAPPGDQYTGMLYAPLSAAIHAAFFRLFWWDGWVMLVASAAGVALAVLVGRVALGGRKQFDARAVIGAIGVGGLAWWMVSTSGDSLLLIPRVDQLAWLFALTGLCVLALGVAHRWPRCWPAVGLLSAALWTKQTTIGAVAAALVVTAWWAATGIMTWRAWGRFALGIGVTNLVALGVLLAMTRGWVWFFMFDLPNRHYSDPAIAPYVSELARLLAIPVLAVAVAGGAAWWARRHSLSSRSFVSLLAMLLIAFLLLQIAPSWIGRRKQGGGVGQYVGMLWALGLLLALAHREARKSTAAMVAGTIVYASLVGIALVTPVREAVTRPGVVEPVAMSRRDVRSIDPRIVDYARSHLVYEPFVGVISDKRTDEIWAPGFNVVDLLAAGESPDYLIDALINRHFDAVEKYPTTFSAYISQSGRTSPEWVKAFNSLIDAGYASGENGAPAPLLGRRAGSIDLSWARDCFDDEHPAACVKAHRGG